MSTDTFKALVHFLVHECRDNPGRLGSIRLNKALWFTDMLAYQDHGAPVTGERYVKRKMGPVPATILATLSALETEGKILIQEPGHRYQPRLFHSLVAPDVDLLSERDRESAKVILDVVCGYTASEVSEVTHDEVWDAAAEGEEIPLFATLASGRGVITDDVKAWAYESVQSMERESHA